MYKLSELEELLGDEALATYSYLNQCVMDLRIPLKIHLFQYVDFKNQ